MFNNYENLNFSFTLVHNQHKHMKKKRG